MHDHDATTTDDVSFDSFFISYVLLNYLHAPPRRAPVNRKCRHATAPRVSEARTLERFTLTELQSSQVVNAGPGKGSGQSMYLDNMFNCPRDRLWYLRIKNPGGVHAKKHTSAEASTRMDTEKVGDAALTGSSTKVSEPSSLPELLSKKPPPKSSTTVSSTSVSAVME